MSACDETRDRAIRPQKLEGAGSNAKGFTSKSVRLDWSSCFWGVFGEVDNMTERMLHEVAQQNNPS